jgi:hypothetical protein
MLELAREAIGRGLSFDEWWREAVRPGVRPVIRTTTPKYRWTPGCVVWPSDSQENIQWRAAILESEEGWRRAYEGWSPEPREKALAILAPLLAGQLPGGDEIPLTLAA